jgi:putative membrane-bound dehydrogenase-like protein
MSRTSFSLVVLLFGFLGPVNPSQGAPLADEPVEVGVARVDITPTYPVRLGGYLARNGESSTVAQRLWAKALAIGSDRQGPVVLVSVDNLGVGEAVVEEVARRLKRRASLDRARFTVASSHTHSAPCLTGVAPHIFGKTIAADEQSRIDRYTSELTDRIEQVSLAALAARKPGRLDWSQGQVGFAANRRTKGGPVDHSLPFLRARDAEGRLVGVVVNYACHCTTLDPKENACSGDWAGFAQTAIEADYPGVVAMTVIGCGADANPLRRLDPGAAATHGRAIAEEFQRLLKGAWEPLAGPPEVAFERFTLPFDTMPTRAELERLVKAGGPAGYNASVQLGKLDRGGPLQSLLNYSVQAWRFGDRLAMVFLPGEVVVDYVLRLKKEFDPKRLWVTAYANDVPCYIPSERVLREGGYEGGGAMAFYARPTRLKAGLEQTIVDAVHRVVPASFRAGVSSAEESPPARAPEEGVKSIRIAAGLRVELVAAEPLIQSPVAIDFGADGKLWVCEMRDYPTGIDGNWKPGGVIKVLEDRDRDGRYETATNFLEGLPFPTGLMAWRKGVIVCAAPDVIYAEDTDGDGKADLRRVLFQGFATENYQARVNGLAYGLDNWVYGANGLIGGSIRGTMTGKVIDIGGRDFRFKPDSGLMEPASGLTQQGRVRDDWGNQFGGNNSVLIQHYPLPDHYARRNPYVAAPGSAVYVPRDPDSTRIYPASQTLARFNHPESANRVTSACSPMIYRDTLLGPTFSGNAFICEPVHNLVHRQVLDRDGVTFAGHRAEGEQSSEFLASTDHWFRPVQVRTGPDGALWVVDMYRFVIEHPRWISPERLAGLDVRAGADKGRIYRVFPENQRPRPLPVLGAKPSKELAAALDDSNGTTRDLVQRLLVERNDATAVPVLRGLVTTAKNPEARSQALCTLDGLGATDAATLLGALGDTHPGVRSQAVRISEPRLPKDEALGRAVLALANDPDPTVRFQAALSLGEWSEPLAGKALGVLATKDAGDRWVLAAILSSSRQHAAAVLEQVIAKAKGRPSPDLIEPLISTLAATGTPETLKVALAAITRPQAASFEVWQLGAVARLLDSSKGEVFLSEPAVRVVTAAARERAAEAGAPAAERAVALRLLGRDPAQREADRETLVALLTPNEPSEVQFAALSALSRLHDLASDQAILSRFSSLGPAARSASLDALLARPESTELLLGAIEAGSLVPSAIDALHRQRLLTAGPDASRRRAEKALGRLAIGPRQAVLEAFASVKALTGNPERGRGIFGRVCAACHKVAGTGHEVGPDLAALTDTSVDALMTAVLDPNREVDARYASYTAALKDGRVVTGLIASETASALTLKRQENQTEVVLRNELEDLKATGQSLMPEGLENDLKPQDLADVIAYLAQGVNRPKSFDGNHPEPVVAEADGTVRLAASTAEIHGSTLVFEKSYGNLGNWQSADDRATWTFRTTRPATYTLTMEWACADESAGNEIAVKVGAAAIRSEVGGTGAGTWSNYRSIFLGEVTLPAGSHRLEIRSAGAVRQALLDLKSVTLTPRSAGVYRAK